MSNVPASQSSKPKKLTPAEQRGYDMAVKDFTPEGLKSRAVTGFSKPPASARTART